MEHRLLMPLPMKPLHRFALLAAPVLAIVAIAAGARAHGRITAANTSDAHTAPTRFAESQGTPGVTTEPSLEVGSLQRIEPRLHEDPVDW